MVNAPVQQGQSAWWVVFYQSATGRASAPNPAGIVRFDVVRADSKDQASQKVGDALGVSVTKVTGPYDGKAQADDAAAQAARRSARAAHQAENQPGGNFGWLTGIGGDIASGIEGGIVNVLKDLWNVISGPVLVIVGAVIALVVLAIYFKNDLIKLGAAGAAAA